MREQGHSFISCNYKSFHLEEELNSVVPINYVKTHTIKSLVLKIFKPVPQIKIIARSK